MTSIDISAVKPYFEKSYLSSLDDRSPNNPIGRHWHRETAAIYKDSSSDNLKFMSFDELVDLLFENLTHTNNVNRNVCITRLRQPIEQKYRLYCLKPVLAQAAIEAGYEMDKNLCFDISLKSNLFDY